MAVPASAPVVAPTTPGLDAAPRVIRRPDRDVAARPLSGRLRVRFTSRSTNQSAIEQHETLAELDEEEQIRQIEAMRADIAKGNRIAEANEQFTQETIAAHQQAQQKPAKKKDPSP